MHTLIIEGTLKSGTKNDFTKAWTKEILPTLKKQQGFVEEVLLFETASPDRGVGLSFWNTKQDAEKYQREVFPRIVDSVQQYIQNPPTVRSFDVEASEMFRIAAGKAA
jgi:heme-degrading monooxygenase HmoA